VGSTECAALPCEEEAMGQQKRKIIPPNSTRTLTMEGREAPTPRTNKGNGNSKI